MRYVIIGAGALLVALLVAGALVGAREPSTVDYARQEAQLAAIARAEARAEAAQPVLTLVAVLLPVVTLAGAVGFLVYLGSLGAAHVYQTWEERSPSAAGLLPVRVTDLATVAPAALGAYHAARFEEARRPVVPTVPHILHYHPTVSGRVEPGPVEPGPVEAELPGVVDLAALTFQPTPQAILLGLGPGGEPITVPAPQLCHVALVGATGGGKSNLMRLLLPQLQAIGARVCLADPHYAPIDPETGEDWRPITQRLHLAPAVSPAEIGALVGYLGDELGRRLEKRRKGERVGPPIFLALDELPVIADTVPGAPAALGKLLREGRKVGLYTVGAAQTFLVKVVGGDSAARECYRTAFYTGGDLRSAAALLDVPQRTIPEGELGRGLVCLRSAVTNPAQLVRVPYASNQGVLNLAASGPASGPASEATPQPQVGREVEGALEGALEAATGAPLPAHQNAQKWTPEQKWKPEEARILEALKAGRSVGDVAAELAGSKAGRKYQEASRLVGDVIRRGLA